MNNSGSEDLWLSATGAVVNGGRWLRAIERRSEKLVPGSLLKIERALRAVRRRYRRRSCSVCPIRTKTFDIRRAAPPVWFVPTDIAPSDGPPMSGMPDSLPHASQGRKSSESAGRFWWRPNGAYGFVQCRASSIAAGGSP